MEPAAQTSNNIHIVLAEQSHKKPVVELLTSHFVTREPICVALGLQWEEAEPTFEAMVERLLSEPHSFVALDTADKNRVIGCRLSAVLVNGADFIEEDFLPVVGDAPTMQRISTIFNTLLKGWTKALPDWTRILEFALMCVDEKYGGRGIAQRLVEKSLNLAEALQVDYVSAVATNVRSQRVLEKFGLRTKRTIVYSELNDENGVGYLMPSDGSVSANWMVKAIKK